MRRLALTLALCACSVAHGDTPPQVTTKPGTASNYVLNVQGNASGTPLPVTGSFSASTTGRATAAAPSYTEGTDNPLSIDLSGNIRTLATIDTSAISTSANQTNGTQKAITRGGAKGATTAADVTSTANGVDHQGLDVQIQNATLAVTQNTSPWVSQDNHTTAGGPLSCELSDGAAFYTGVKTGQLPAALDGSGFLKTHEQGTAAVSGTFWPTTAGAPSSTRLSDGAAFYDARSIRALTSTDVVTATQGNAGTNAQAWWTQIGDTTNGPTAVKAASTAAVATDKALVVAVSPNNTVAATESGTWTVQPGNTANTTAWLMNVGQFGGTNVSTGTGAGGAGIPRVTISNDSSLAANQSVNLAQVGGTNTLTGGTAGSLGVGGLAADGSAVSGNPVLVAGKGFNGISQALRLNCDKRAAFSTLGTTATVQQIALVAGQTIYVCGWYALISTAVTAVNIKWVTGTGTNCATGIADVTPLIFTTPTAAPAISNWNQAPMTGPPVAFSASASALCITQSSATNSTTLSGVIYYTQN